MATINDFDELLTQIRCEWDRAEHSIKLAEQVRHQVVFPAIKELRYAGRRIVDALAECAHGGDDQTVRALLSDALFDCYRARHDAVDAIVSTIAAELDVTAKRLGYRPLIDAFQDYPSLLADLADAQNAIAESRGMRQERDKLYSALESVNITKIISLYRKFKASEKVIRGLAKEDRRSKVAGIVGAVLGILATVVFGYLSL